MYGIWAVGFIARSRLGFTLRLLAKTIKIAVAIKGRIVNLLGIFQKQSEAKEAGQMRVHQWSGLLR